MVAPAGLPAVSVKEWAAWAPGLTEKAHWSAFLKAGGDISQDGSPEAGFIPPLLRRRMSRLNRMALTAAFSCCSYTQISNKCMVPLNDMVPLWNLPRTCSTGSHSQGICSQNTWARSRKRIYRYSILQSRR